MGYLIFIFAYICIYESMLLFFTIYRRNYQKIYQEKIEYLVKKTMRCAVNSVHCKISTPCIYLQIDTALTLYNIKCTLYSVQCTSLTIHST